MGIFRAFSSSLDGVLADQWKEYFYCDALPDDTLMVRGKKRTSANSANHGSDEVITDGSIFAVADGQAVIAVSSGKILDVCTEPGEHEYRSGKSSTVFGKGGLGNAAKEVGNRFAFGGAGPIVTQRVYYFNTREMMGNPFTVPGGLVLRTRDDGARMDVDVSYSCTGMYSFRITKPEITYKSLIGNVSGSYTKGTLCRQMESELRSVILSAAASLNEEGTRPSGAPALLEQLPGILMEKYNRALEATRGVEICSIAFSSLTPMEADRAAFVRQLQIDRALTNPDMARAHLVGALTSSMQMAAANPNGMSPLAAAILGGSAPGQSGEWTCTCGQKNTRNFCSECGAKKPGT